MLPRARQGPLVRGGGALARREPKPAPQLHDQFGMTPVVRLILKPCPVAPVAVTRTRRKEPLSAAFTTYVFELAPVMAVHATGTLFGFLSPALVQRYHWYAYVTGPFVH